MAEILIAFSGQAEDINEFNFALFETNSLEAGAKKEIPGGVTLTMRPMMERKAYGIPKAIEIVLSVTGGMAVNLASSYIYDKLKKHHGENLSMTVNSREVHFDKEDIIKVIEEEIKIYEQ
jgi:hypothetical protein